MNKSNKDKVINLLLERIAKLEYEVEELQKENDLDCNLNKSLLKDIDKAGKEIERLNNIIKIMEKYFEMILDLGYDYDGLNEKESLKKLINELCRYASLGRAYNTTEIIYVNGNKKFNILNEELKGRDEE